MKRNREAGNTQMKDLTSFGAQSQENEAKCRSLVQFLLKSAISFYPTSLEQTEALLKQDGKLLWRFWARRSVQSSLVVPQPFCSSPMSNIGIPPNDRLILQLRLLEQNSLKKALGHVTKTIEDVCTYFCARNPLEPANSIVLG